MISSCLRSSASALLAITVLSIGIADQASGQSTCSGTMNAGLACTITNSSSAAVTVPGGASTLSIDNESSSATIACALNNSTAAINTAGSYTMPPNTTRLWSLDSRNERQVFAGVLNCISSAATSPATIEIH